MLPAKLFAKLKQLRTKLTLTQDNVLSDKEKDHAEENWKMVLKKLKEVAETMI